jgi:hypothetical protein
MAESQVERHSGLPRTIALFESIPLAPIWIGLLIAGLWFSVYLIYAYLVGWIDGARLLGDPLWKMPAFWFELIQAAMVGYAPTVTTYWLQGTVQDLHALRPALACSDTEFQAELKKLTGFERRPQVLAALVGVGIGLGTVFYPGIWFGGRPALGDPLLTWGILRSVVLFSLVVHTVYVSIALTSRLSRTGEERAQVDLLDVTPLMPFARNGLREALLLMGCIVLTSVLLLAPWSGDIAVGGLCVVLGWESPLCSGRSSVCTVGFVRQSGWS